VSHRLTTSILLLSFVLTPGCSRLEPLTESNLTAAEELWQSNAPGWYRAVIEISGERVESGTFEVLVRNNAVVGITLDGQTVRPARSEDYSIKGLFGILRQELALAEEPQLLGAPAGYEAYLLVRFDPETGRLEYYTRNVGGASNSIDIEVAGFEVQVRDSDQPSP
jgi:hypothetical protein